MCIRDRAYACTMILQESTFWHCRDRLAHSLMRRLLISMACLLYTSTTGAYIYASVRILHSDTSALCKKRQDSVSYTHLLTLIGPNGAGKSTILKSIARQLSLVSGTIYLDKSDVVTTNGNEFAKKMAVVLTDKMCIRDRSRSVRKI